MKSAVRSLLFSTTEVIEKRALREYYLNNRLSEIVVLKPSENTRNCYVCLVTKRKGFFVNYNREKIAKKFHLKKPALIVPFEGGRASTHKHVFYCLMDTSSYFNLSKQLYSVQGIIAVFTTLMNRALNAKLNVSEGNPALLDRMHHAYKCTLVHEAIASAIREGHLPDINFLSLDDKLSDILH